MKSTVKTPILKRLTSQPSCPIFSLLTCKDTVVTRISDTPLPLVLRDPWPFSKSYQPREVIRFLVPMVPQYVSCLILFPTRLTSHLLRSIYRSSLFPSVQSSDYVNGPFSYEYRTLFLTVLLLTS